MFLRHTVQLLFLAACFSSVAFASKPTTLAVATPVQSTTTITRCQIKSHAEALAERSKIANAIIKVTEPGKDLLLASPLIQIVASYCVTPMSWQKKRKLRLRNDGCSRYVHSIAQLSADRIAVSYRAQNDQPVGERTVKISNKAAIWDLRNLGTDSQPPVPDTQTLDSYAGHYFTALSDGIIKADADRARGTLELVNTDDGSAQPIEIGSGYMLSSCVSLPWALCAVGAHDGTVHIVGHDHTVKELITAHNTHDPEISALYPLPHDGLAIGDLWGMIRVIEGINGALSDPSKPCTRIEVRRYNDNGKQEFSVDAIVGWPEGIMAALLRHGVIEGTAPVVDDRHIEFWDSSYKSLGVLLESGRDIHGICALPHSQLAVYFNGRDKHTPHVLAIYKFSIDANAQASLKLEQELSFASDPISQSAPLSFMQHIPFCLTKSERPTMAIGTESGAVQIWEEDVCPDCKPAKATKA